MENLLVYSAFQDIKYDLTKAELIDIIDKALELDDLDQAITDYLTSNYNDEDIKGWCKNA